MKRRYNTFDEQLTFPLLDEQRLAARRAEFLTTARRLRPAVEARRAQQAKLPFNLKTPLTRRQMMIATILAVLLFVGAGTGGTIYAADGAVPGDLLYGVDRAAESARLGLTSQPAAKADLLVSFAAERLAEARALLEDDRSDAADVAINGYVDTVSALVDTLGAMPEAERGRVSAQIDTALAAQEAELDALLANPAVAAAAPGPAAPDVAQQTASTQAPTAVPGGPFDDGADDPDPDDEDYCVGAEPHPVGQKLADAYGVPYEDIMDWFCTDGYGMGEIEHALWTAEQADMTPQEVFDLYEELGGWGEVWQELGLIGNGAGDDDQDDDQDDDGDDGDEGDVCTGADPHPVGERLAEEYDVPYEDIMSWFCDDHFGFGEIKLALAAAEKLDMDPQELLDMRAELGGWGQVWKELGFHGRPKDKGKQGGDQDENTGQGAGSGKPEKPDKEDKPKPDKPDKPDKPAKPEKPDKPEKPEKPDNPGKGNK